MSAKNKKNCERNKWAKNQSTDSGNCRRGYYRGSGYWRGKHNVNQNTYGTFNRVCRRDKFTDDSQSSTSSVSRTPTSQYDHLQQLGRNCNMQPCHVQTRLSGGCPYKGWLHYFPHETFENSSDVVKKCKVFEKLLSTLDLTSTTDDIEDKKFVNLDFQKITSDTAFQKDWITFNDELIEEPNIVLPILGLAIHKVLSDQRDSEVSHWATVHDLHSSKSELLSLPKITARLVNFDHIVPLKDLKANFYGKFVSICGTVLRVGPIKPLCTKMGFECTSCGEEQCWALADGKYSVPIRCMRSDCRGRNFVPKHSSKYTETIDWQTIRIQELNDQDNKNTGRIPRTIDCDLTEDLVDCCVPGDVITLSGIVKVNASEEGKSSRNKDKCLFILYIHANSVVALTGHKSVGQAGGVGLDYSLQDLYSVREIQAHPQLFRLLVASLSPTICGHEMVKAGFILSLFGAHQMYANDKNKLPVRGDIHVLVVGDPGIGKSQMLRAVSNVAPRSVYVCGNNSTTAGLTVSMMKEGGDQSLQAGALVLADHGCCCIDEFDKMSAQHAALLEAMEQQSISIAKAGIVCNLPARTAIIAAANPVGGHYDKAKTVSENLKLNGALLSRFDLVFILLDKADANLDDLMSTHVMGLHTVSSLNNRKSAKEESSSYIDQEDCRKQPLHQQLKVPKNISLNYIPHPVLRKYIGYARQYVQSMLSPEAAKVIQEFFLKLRQNYHQSDSTPITTRQLESLIRLTQARARVELREIAIEDDAKDVIEIMKYSMCDTFSDRFGKMDFRRSQHGSGMSGRSKPKKFIAALERVSNQTSNSVFTVLQLKQLAKDLQMPILDFESFIESLNTHGFLLKKGPRLYQLQTSEF